MESKQRRAKKKGAEKGPNQENGIKEVRIRHFMGKRKEHSGLGASEGQQKRSGYRGREQDRLI